MVDFIIVLWVVMSVRVFMIICVVDCIYEWVVVWLVSRIGGTGEVGR